MARWLRNLDLCGQCCHRRLMKRWTPTENSFESRCFIPPTDSSGTHFKPAGVIIVKLLRCGQRLFRSCTRPVRFREWRKRNTGFAKPRARHRQAALTGTAFR